MKSLQASRQYSPDYSSQYSLPLFVELNWKNNKTIKFQIGS